MPKLDSLQTNFSSGQLHPTVQARVDLAKYYNGLALAQNLIVLPQGGVTRRPGLRFVAPVKDETAPVRLVPFVFSQDQSYVVEVGENYFRFFADHGQVMDGAVPYEVAHSFIQAHLGELSHVQSADTMFWAHQSYAPTKLIREGHTDWSFLNQGFRPGGLGIRVHQPTTQTLTLSAVSGSGVTATASSAYFQDGDVGRLIISGSGQGIITQFNSSTVVLIDVLDAFAGTGPIAAAAWRLQGSPTGGIWVPNTLAKSYGGVGSIQADPFTPKDMFRAEDVGCYLSFTFGADNQGFVLITAYVSAQEVRVMTIYPLPEPFMGASETTYYWDLWQNAWTSGNYPGLVTLEGNRLIYAGTPSQPLTIWESQINNFNNFAIGSLDSQAMSFSLAADQIDRLLWLQSEGRLIIGSPGGVWNVGSSQGPVSPGNPPEPKMQPRIGSLAAPPVLAGNALLYIQSDALKVRELIYSFEVDRYVAPDLAILTDVTNPGLEWLAFAPEPVALIWARRTDGVLATMTYEREEKVVGWTEGLITDGVIESHCVIPYGNRWELWVVVRRTVNGATRRYVEYLEDLQLPADQTDWFFVDSGLTYSGLPATVISGLDHLEGKTVEVLTDGAWHPDRMVSGGAITLEAAASKVQVGLPYASLGRTLPLEAGQQGGTLQGRIKRVAGVRLRFYRTLGCEIGESLDDMEEVFQRQVETLMGTPEGEYTGDYPMESGWLACRGDHNPHGQIYFRQAKPLPLTLLGMAAQVEVN